MKNQRVKLLIKKMALFININIIVLKLGIEYQNVNFEFLDFVSDAGGNLRLEARQSILTRKYLRKQDVEYDYLLLI